MTVSAGDEVPGDLKKLRIGRSRDLEADITEIPYNKLMSLGMAIIGEKTSSQYFSGHRVAYKIVQTEKGANHINKIPNRTPHTLEYDRANKRVRLKGKNAGRYGVSEWVNLKSKKRELSQKKSFGY